MAGGKVGFNTARKLRTGGLLVLAAIALTVGAAAAQDGDESAEEVFRDHISDPVVQAKCVNCHVQGGLSGHTRLVFVSRLVDPDHETLNLRAFRNLLDALRDEGGGAHILNKIQGVAHGGGPQVESGSQDFANMQRFLGLLGQAVTTAAVTPDTLFDTVVLASSRQDPAPRGADLCGPCPHAGGVRRG